MKNAYPVIMTQGKEFIVVFIPDFNINTQGKDVPDAIEMARDAIGLMGELICRITVNLCRNRRVLQAFKLKHHPARSFRWLTLTLPSIEEKTICAS